MIEFLMWLCLLLIVGLVIFSVPILGAAGTAAAVLKGLLLFAVIAAIVHVGSRFAAAYRGEDPEEDSL